VGARAATDVIMPPSSAPASSPPSPASQPAEMSAPRLDELSIAAQAVEIELARSADETMHEITSMTVDDEPIQSHSEGSERSAVETISETISDQLGEYDLESGPRVLWRGMRQMTIPEAFLQQGGTEVAPMSTTADLAVAVRYSLSPHSILFRLETDSFITRGSDISYLSAFPAESEFLYPPLTFLSPVGSKPLKMKIGPYEFTVLTVRPHL